MHISIISDLDRHLSFIQCRTPYHPFATSSCTISLDMNLTLRIHTRWIPFSCLSFCLGHKDGGCSSVLDPLPCSLCSLKVELGTDSVFLVGIWLVFLGFYQTDTGGKLSRYVLVLLFWREPLFSSKGGSRPPFLGAQPPF